MLQAIDGYKTYIVAALLGLLAFARGVLGWDIPGMAAANDWLAWLLVAAGLGTGRHGVAKVQRQIERMSG